MMQMVIDGALFGAGAGAVYLLVRGWLLGFSVQINHAVATVILSSIVGAAAARLVALS